MKMETTTMRARQRWQGATRPVCLAALLGLLPPACTRDALSVTWAPGEQASIEPADRPDDAGGAEPAATPDEPDPADDRDFLTPADPDEALELLIERLSEPELGRLIEGLGCG
jgi:hypothetical protein